MTRPVQRRLGKQRSCRMWASLLKLLRHGQCQQRAVATISPPLIRPSRYWVLAAYRSKIAASPRCNRISLLTDKNMVGPPAGRSRCRLVLRLVWQRLWSRATMAGATAQQEAHVCGALAKRWPHCMALYLFAGRSGQCGRLLQAEKNLSRRRCPDCHNPGPDVSTQLNVRTNCSRHWNFPGCAGAQRVSSGAKAKCRRVPRRPMPRVGIQLCSLFAHKRQRMPCSACRKGANEAAKSCQESELSSIRHLQLKPDETLQQWIDDTLMETGRYPVCI